MPVKAYISLSYHNRSTGQLVHVAGRIAAGGFVKPVLTGFGGIRRARNCDFAGAGRPMIRGRSFPGGFYFAVGAGHSTVMVFCQGPILPQDYFGISSTSLRRYGRRTRGS
jgi:hypothetical protein